MLRKWYVRIRIVQAGHYKDAARYKHKNTLLGTLVVVFSSVVGTSLFASLDEDATGTGSGSLQIALGLTSVAAAVLAALQTFLDYAAKSAKHLEAATKLSALKKEIEKNLVLLAHDDTQLGVFITQAKSQWDAITSESPLVSDKAFATMFRKYGGDDQFLAAIDGEDKPLGQ